MIIDPEVLEIVKQSRLRHYSKREAWTKVEEEKFVEALQLHGKDWDKVTLHVFTRSQEQNRQHYRDMMEKFRKDSPSVLTTLQT